MLKIVLKTPKNSLALAAGPPQPHWGLQLLEPTCVQVGSRGSAAAGLCPRKKSLVYNFGNLECLNYDTSFEF